MSGTDEPTPLPSAEAVRRLLRDLLEREVTAAPAPPLALGGAAAVGVYRGDHGALEALALCDGAFGTRAGAALALIPAEDGDVRAGRIRGAMIENLHEVLNVVGACLNEAGGAHASLRALHVPPATAPREIAQAARGAVARLDLAVTIAGYGTGKLTLLRM